MGRFESTQWSIVLAARDQPTTLSRKALAALCETYWKPLYYFVRKKGHDAQEAQDLTQEFFARFIEKDYLKTVDRDRGTFRSFLLAAMAHFLANEWEKARAQKRGGGALHLSLDFTSVDNESPLELAGGLSPERLFERQWALAVLAKTLESLERAYATTGKQALFAALKGQLTGASGAAPYADIARALGMSENAVKVAVHRLRKRYREALKREIAQTVEHPGDVDAELQHLFQALSYG